MKIAIIGLGYVGLAVARSALAAGVDVVGIEKDVDKVSKLSKTEDFAVSSDYSLIANCEVVIIAVPTPLNESREPDLSLLVSACKSLSKNLKSGTLVVNESTSYPGTLRNVIAPILGDDYLYASAPERIDPANVNWGIDNTPRLVSGIGSKATSKALMLYRMFCEHVVEVSSPEVAEAAKLFENTFRQVNIALVNEFAQIASALGISTFETLQAAATKPYGFMSFIPSVGVGGHCIPVDPSYLSHAAREAGVEASFINLANKVNESMPEYVANRIEIASGGSLKDRSVQIAGISYKADVSDTRESPALVLMSELRNKGAEVTWCDEVVESWKNERSTPLSNVEIGVIATAHTGVDYSPWKNGRTMVFDVSAAAHTGWPKFL